MLFVILVCLMKNLKLEFLSFVSYKRWNGSFLHFGIFRIFIDFFVNDQHSSVTLMEFVLITWVKKAKREDEVEKNQSPTSLHCQFATKTKEQKKAKKAPKRQFWNSIISQWNFHSKESVQKPFQNHDTFASLHRKNKKSDYYYYYENILMTF